MADYQLQGASGPCLPIPMSLILTIAGLVAFAFGCRTFQSRWLAKLGWIALLVATYLGGYYLSGSHAVGAASVGLWFVLPWVEIVARVRKLRFPLHNSIVSRFPPPRDIFPDLGELSSEVEECGFEEAENSGWEWEETEHFMRLFYHPELRTQAAVTLAQQEDYAVSYVSVTSRTRDGRTWTTSNYPFSFTMKFSPDHKVNRHVAAESFEDLLTSHREFLKAQQVAESDLAEMDPENLSHYLTEDMAQQIQHNVKVGVLEPAGEDGIFRYSWRGCIFLWVQVVKDMILV